MNCVLCSFRNIWTHCEVSITIGDFRNISTISIHILIGSSTLRFLQFWYVPKWHQAFFKKIWKKNARWRCCLTLPKSLIGVKWTGRQNGKQKQRNSTTNQSFLMPSGVFFEVHSIDWLLSQKWLFARVDFSVRIFFLASNGLYARNCFSPRNSFLAEITVQQKMHFG